MPAAAPPVNMTAPEDAEMPTEFRVRILSDEEHDAIKRRVELPDDHED
jgi:hypothetical protein